MSRFDAFIHQAVRLRIMSALCALASDESVDFTFLKKMLGLTDGNLGSHLEKLELEDYIQVKRDLTGKKPKTFIAATSLGRAAYEGHRSALNEILRDSGS